MSKRDLALLVMKVEREILRSTPNLLCEGLDKSDIQHVAKIVRLEVARIMFDLFRLRNQWA